MDFVKIRQETASEFTCARCKKVKTSKLRFACTEDGETQYICNACYGFLMSGTTSTDTTGGSAMNNDNQEYMSLCVVIESKSGDKGLKRLADIEDGVLKNPLLTDEDPPNKFRNRMYFLRKNGPDTIGTFGVWKWSAVPNEKDPQKDYITISYMADIQAAEILEVPPAQSVNDMIKTLREEGMSSLPASSKFLFGIRREKYYEGVICTSKDIHVNNGKVYVNDDVLTLPVYLLSLKNTISLNGRTFYRSLECGSPIKVLPLREPSDVIRDILARHFTWPSAKSIGLTKSAWQSVKELLTAGAANTILQDTAEVLGCSEAEAQWHIDNFLARAESYINAEDYDSEFILRLLDRHTELMKKCEDLAAETFRKEHQEEFDRAGESLRVVLSSLEAKTGELEALERKISSGRQRLSVLTAEIHEHEHLAEKVSEHVRKRIEGARSDAAAFIAEMAFAPQEISRKTHTAIHNGENLTAEKLPLLTDWNEAVQILGYELLEAGVAGQYSSGFAAFICAAFLNNMPLLLAGPNAGDIADAFCAALFGRTAGVIDCSGQYCPEIESEIAASSDEVFAVKNALRTEWTAHIPALQRLGKYFFIVHPFAEDLMIEPKSLFSYALPVFTELTADSVPSRKFAGARKAPGFREFTHGTAKNIPDVLLRGAGITPFTRSRLRAVLADFHVLHPEDVNLDGLFVLFPYAYINGRAELVLEKLPGGTFKDELKIFVGDSDE